MGSDVSLDRISLTKAAVAAGSFLVLWLALAVARPSTTFHFGPLIVAAVLPYAYASFAGRRPQRSAAVAMVAGGTVAALITTALLAGLDRMAGPSLLPTGGAVLEAVVFALVGGSIGLLTLAGRPASGER